MNPELRKNFWLELTAQRLIVGPLILLLIFLISYLNGNELFNTALTIGILVCALWGTKNAASSIIEETKQKTWDFIKVSSLSPVKLIIGKVFGATSYMWILTAICLVVGGLSFPAIDSTFNYKGYFDDKLILFLLFTVLLGMTCHFTAYLFAIKSIRREHAGQKMDALLITIFIIMMAGTLFVDFTELPRQLAINNASWWYSIPTATIGFKFLELGFYGFWTIIGCYIITKIELGYKISNFAWVSFLVFLSFYIFGYLYEDNIDYLFGYKFQLANASSSLVIFFGQSAIIFATLFYVTLLLEKKDLITLKKLRPLFKDKKYLGLDGGFPTWYPTFLFFATAIIIMALVNSQHIYIYLSILFLVIRDAALIIYCNITKNKRADVTAIVYLVILYGILPMLTSSLVGNAYLAAFIPYESSNLLSIAVIALQAAGLCFLTFKIIKSRSAIT